MPGITLYPQYMLDKTSAMLGKLGELEPNVLAAKGALDKISFSTLLLQGVAWNSVRAYVQNVQKPLMSTYSLWLTEQRNATVVYKNAAGRLPEVYKLDQDQLREMLGRYETRLDREWNKREPKMSRIKQYNRMIYQINLKLEAIDDFLAETAGAYQEALSIQGVLKRAYTELPNVHYNPQLQEVDYSSVAVSWLLNLKDMAKRERLAVNKLEENPDPLSLEDSLTLILGENGNLYLSELLSKEEITDEEYLMIAMALIMSGDDQLVSTALNGCYQQTDVKEMSVGGLTTVNVIFEKTERLEKLEQCIKVTANMYIKAASAATPEEVAKMKDVLQNAMQYNQLFMKAECMGETLVTSSYSNTSGTVKVKGDPLITLIRDKNNDLNMGWYEYPAGNPVVDFTTLKESKLIVSYPAKGSAAQLRSSEEGLRYIRSNLGIGNNAGNFADNVGQEFLGMAVEALPVKGIDMAISLLSIVSGQAETNSDRAAFDEGVGITELGTTLDMFKLFYVSSVIEKGGKEMEHNFSVYPSFQGAGSDVKSTRECIDNFNKNFGDGGKLEKPGRDLDINPGLTIEQIQDDFPKVAEMIKSWSDYCDKNACDMEEATSTSK